MGGYHGACQIIGEITEPLKKKIYSLLRIDVSTELHKLWKQVVTFVLVDIGWIFFRVNSVKEGIEFIKGIVENMHFTNFIQDPIGHFSAMGFSINDVIILFCGIMVLWAVDCKKSKCNVIEWVTTQNFLSRWAIYLSLLFIIIIYGAYGMDYQQTEFIYFQF